MGLQVVFARLVVLASSPFVEGRGLHLLTFMQHFAPNINKHLTPLWDQRIPLLLHYLDTHANFGDGVGNAWDQVSTRQYISHYVDGSSEKDIFIVFANKLCLCLCCLFSLGGIALKPFNYKIFYIFRLSGRNGS